MPKPRQRAVENITTIIERESERLLEKSSQSHLSSEETRVLEALGKLAVSIAKLDAEKSQEFDRKHSDKSDEELLAALLPN